ncbi:hypothetical protein EJB05_48138 [Eragrostis curvula]|uniref:BTB domain-containing protein n=1 Tax=Eragrostis curvula TaxID=38414 RepID=A0A5J9T2B2_9POAL|nr:hypothetical protein EJB05_48138 [Eragrostis curvula]
MVGVGDEAAGGSGGPSSSVSGRQQIHRYIRFLLSRPRSDPARLGDFASALGAGAPRLQVGAREPSQEVRGGGELLGQGSGRRSLVPTRGHSRQRDSTKRQRTSGPEAQTTMMMDSSSAVLKFKVDYEKTKHLAIGKAVHSDAISAGGHMWRINCYPRGAEAMVSGKGECLSLFVELLSKSRSVKAIVEAFLINKGGEPSLKGAKRAGVHVFQMDNKNFGWHLFVKQTDLVKYYVTDGQITFMCCIMVLEDNSIPVPPSDIGKDLGRLLDSTDGADVSFKIDGETFHAHRAVLAVRSSVFRAELLGSMAEATMFKAMLRFMYSDSLSGDNELEDTPSEIMHDLLAAADRYALDRLKLMCAQNLLDNVSVDSVAVTLACAEMYNLPELKSRCMDFFAKEESFKKAVLTKGFLELGLQFPPIFDELRKRVGL